jgi:hypothetical protein
MYLKIKNHMKNKLKLLGLFLLKNNIFRICLCIVLVLIGVVLFNLNIKHGDIVFYIGLGGLALHALVFIVYAWIINPLRNFFTFLDNE